MARTRSSGMRLLQAQPCFLRRKEGQPESQPDAEKTEGEKLRVDNRVKRPHMSFVDICLLSFSYCAFDTAPWTNLFFQKSLFTIPSASGVVVLYCYERVHHDHWHS